MHCARSCALLTMLVTPVVRFSARLNWKRLCTGGQQRERTELNLARATRGLSTTILQLGASSSASDLSDGCVLILCHVKVNYNNVGVGQGNIAHSASSTTAFPELILQHPRPQTPQRKPPSLCTSPCRDSMCAPKPPALRHARERQYRKRRSK